MRIGFIGAGRAACNLGKYFSLKKNQADVEVSGYYDLVAPNAKWAADFTDSNIYESIDEVIVMSDSIILSTPDGAIKKVWDMISKDQIGGKIICHLSGSLSSDVFSGIEGYGAYPVSIHPFVAFSDRESVYKQLDDVCFTLEGHSYAVKQWRAVFDAMNNMAIEISKDVKPLYHAAASVLSNHVVAVLDMGYRLLEQCGFSEEDARKLSSSLVKNNMNNVIHFGSVNALTGPIERGDVETVRKHLSVLDIRDSYMYKANGKALLDIAKRKNPDKDYTELDNIMSGDIL